MFSSLLRRPALASVSAALVTTQLITLAPIAQAAGDWNQFDVCVTELLANGVDPDAAAAGCSEAIIPKEMSGCVSMIRNNTNIDGNVALRACFQVRRPIDLGNCVVDIDKGVLQGYRAPSEKTESAEAGTEGAETTMVAQAQQESYTPFALVSDDDDLELAALQTCRQSLLPGRHSECVIALSRDVDDFTPAKAMNTCLAAEDFPRDLFPAYTENES